MMNDGLSGGQFTVVQEPAALIISPTRELASQIYMEARKFSHKTALRAVVCYGGVSVAYQAKQIEYGCHMLVATPGRLKDFAERKKVTISNIYFPCFVIYIFHEIHPDLSRVLLKLHLTQLPPLIVCILLPTQYERLARWGISV